MGADEIDARTLREALCGVHQIATEANIDKQLIWISGVRLQSGSCHHAVPQGIDSFGAGLGALLRLGHVGALPCVHVIWTSHPRFRPRL